jgi:hypothetical protein
MAHCVVGPPPPPFTTHRLVKYVPLEQMQERAVIVLCNLKCVVRLRLCARAMRGTCDCVCLTRGVRA